MKNRLTLIVLILVLTFGSLANAGTAHQSQDHKSGSQSGTMKSGVTGDTFTHQAVVEGVRAEFKVMSLASMNMKDPEGNTTYPHYDTVRETMAQLLEAGLADDLNGAYDQALRHPRHAELYDSIATQQAEKVEADRLEKIRQETLATKSNQVSVTGSTPQTQKPEATKGVRGALESAFDQYDTNRI